MGLFTPVAFFGVEAVSFDPDALLFLTNTGITNQVIRAAINSLVLDLKSYNLWTKMYAVYPFVGGTADTHKYNLRNPAGTTASYTLNFVGGFSHSVGGVKPNGVDTFADTFAQPSVVFTNNDTHFSFYSRENLFGTHTEYGVEVSGDGPTNNRIVLHTAYSDNNSYSDMYNSGTGRITYTGASASNANSLFISSRTTSSVHKLYRNGVQVGATNTGASGNVNAIINTMYMFGLRKFTNAVNDRSTKQAGFASFGLSLTDADAANLYTAVRSFSINLGRNTLGVCSGDLISATDLRGYWKLNGTVRDSSGRGVATTGTNLDYVLGPHIDLGYAASIRRAADGSATGSQIYIENAALTQSSSGQPFTVACWINLRSHASANTLRALVGKYQVGSPSGGYDFRFYTDPSNNTILQFFVGNSTNALGNRDSSANWTFSSTASLPINTWHHVAGVYDGTKTYVYHNGICVATASGLNTTNCTNIFNTTRRTTIGYNDLGSAPNNQTRYLDGRIDDVVIFWRD